MTPHGLSKGFVDENFDFYLKTLARSEQLSNRAGSDASWSAMDEELGEALRQTLRRGSFPAQERALEMVNNLKEALADRIKAASVLFVHP